jgi:hypothetical protein
MTDDRMALAELLQKSGDGDFLRSVAEAVPARALRPIVKSGLTRPRQIATQRRQGQPVQPWNGTARHARGLRRSATRGCWGA